MRLNEGLDDSDELHEINVTPFIDVMLVLLIIFMVAAPLATVDIRVDLPAYSAKPQTRPEKTVFLSVKADKQLYVTLYSLSVAQFYPTTSHISVLWTAFTHRRHP